MDRLMQLLAVLALVLVPGVIAGTPHAAVHEPGAAQLHALAAAGQPASICGAGTETEEAHCPWCQVAKDAVLPAWEMGAAMCVMLPPGRLVAAHGVLTPDDAPPCHHPRAPPV